MTARNAVPEIPELLSYEDLEQVFGLGHRAIWERFVRTGKLKPLRFSSKTIRFLASDVHQVINEIVQAAFGSDVPPA